VNENWIEVYLDDNPEPVAAYSPPDRFELDTNLLDDGPHILRIIAVDRSGHRGVRTIPFEVRNGPGIAVDGLKEDDIIEGKINILINAYGGAYEEKWEPSRAETPAPIPTWAWVSFIFITAWAVFYGVQQWNPTARFRNTPTYGSAYSLEKAEEGEAAGAYLYRTSCASCHQNNGQGVHHVFPPLADDPVVTAEDPTEHIRVVLFGKQGSTIDGIAYNAHMPAWADQLSDEEIAAVVNHERTSWGNNAPPVTEEDVERIRKSGDSGRYRSPSE
jgi:mono/diheme cytochrome c family protein